MVTINFLGDVSLIKTLREVKPFDEGMATAFLIEMVNGTIYRADFSKDGNPSEKLYTFVRNGELKRVYLVENHHKMLLKQISSMLKEQRLAKLEGQQTKVRSLKIKMEDLVKSGEAQELRVISNLGGNSVDKRLVGLVVDQYNKSTSKCHSKEHEEDLPQIVRDCGKVFEDTHQIGWAVRKYISKGKETMKYLCRVFSVGDDGVVLEPILLHAELGEASSSIYFRESKKFFDALNDGVVEAISSAAGAICVKHNGLEMADFIKKLFG